MSKQNNQNILLEKQSTGISTQITDYMVEHIERLIVRGYFDNKSSILRKAVQKIVYEERKNKRDLVNFQSPTINN